MKALTIIITTLSVFFFISSSCKRKSCSDSEKATLVDASGIGGCGMIIKLKNGKSLEPKNLNDFNIDPKDGEKIWVSYHSAKSGGTICMMGDIVIIDCISKR